MYKRQVYEDTAPWETAGSGAGALSVQEDDYSQDHSEQGVNYDSIFVPEEPKRVVTAGGKVIETETELLQKKLEKKRQAAADPAQLRRGRDRDQYQLRTGGDPLRAAA